MNWKRRLVYSLFQMNYYTREELFYEFHCPDYHEVFEDSESQCSCLIRWCRLQGQIVHLAARVAELVDREG